MHTTVRRVHEFGGECMTSTRQPHAIPRTCTCKCMHTCALSASSVAFLKLEGTLNHMACSIFASIMSDSSGASARSGAPAEGHRDRKRVVGSGASGEGRVGAAGSGACSGAEVDSAGWAYRRSGTRLQAW